MKERITAIKVNLRMLLQQVEKMHLDKTDYEALAKIKKIEEKVFELGDMIEEIERALEMRNEKGW